MTCYIVNRIYIGLTVLNSHRLSFGDFLIKRTRRTYFVQIRV